MSGETYRAQRPGNLGPLRREKYACRMQPDARQFGKAERQRLIASLVSRRRIGTQHDLLAALAAEGCLATQATVSRDIRELGLEKTHDQLGRPRYVVPQDGRRADPREALASVLSQFGRRAQAAQNIVVVQSELGSAPAIARGRRHVPRDRRRQGGRGLACQGAGGDDWLRSARRLGGAVASRLATSSSSRSSPAT